MNQVATAVRALLILTISLCPVLAGATQPRLRLEYLDLSRCASAGLLTAWVTALELEGTLLRMPADGFKLVIDTRPQTDPPLEVVKFETSKRPLKVALVIQTGEAYAKDLASIKEGATALLRAVPARTRISVIQFAVEARRVIHDAPAREAVKALRQLQADGTTVEPALVSAVKMGLRGLSDDRKVRRLLVVVSDGLNNSHSRALFRAMGDTAQKSGIPIHPVAYSPDDDRGPLLNLGEIARRSRGTFRWARSADQLKQQFQNLGREITDQRGMTFKVPDRCAAPHKIKVHSATLRSRVVPTPGQKPVQQGPVKKGPTVRKLDGGSKIWIAVVVGLVLLLVAAVIIALVARRWMAKKRAGLAPEPPAPGPREVGRGGEPDLPDRHTSRDRPIQPVASDARLPITGEHGIQPVPSEPGLQATGGRPIQPVPSDAQLYATGQRQLPTGPAQHAPPLQAAASDPGPYATGQRQIPPPPHGAPQQAYAAPAVAQAPIEVVVGPRLAIVGCGPPVEGWNVPLPEGEALVGTAPDCLLRLDESHGISIYHASLTFQQGQLTVEDLESRTGVFVNRQQVTRVVLHEGDYLQLGRALFLVQAR